MIVKFDGYAFGDRLLEDVYFQADITNGVVSNVAIAPENDDSYWSDLNQAKWLQEAKTYIETTLQNEYGNDLNAMIADGMVIV